MQALSFLVLVVLFVATVSQVNVVSDCSALANDKDACLNSKEGNVFPDDYCSYCVTGEDYIPSCMTWKEEKDTNPSVTACWDQVAPGVDARNTTQPLEE